MTCYHNVALGEYLIRVANIPAHLLGSVEQRLKKLPLEKTRLVINQTYLGGSPLLKAASFCNTPLIQLLIKYGADVNYINELGETALLKAAASEDIKMYRIGNKIEDGGSLETVKLLLSHGAQINPARFISPLIRATSSGSLHVARLLIELGAQVNYVYLLVESMPITALSKAIGRLWGIDPIHSNKEIMEFIEFLLEKGATPLPSDVGLLESHHDNQEKRDKCLKRIRELTLVVPPPC